MNLPKILLAGLPAALCIMRQVEQLLWETDGFRVECAAFDPGLESAADRFMLTVSESGAQCVIVATTGETIADVTSLLRELTPESRQSPILIIAEQADSTQIIELLKLGAADFILHPSTALDVIPRVWQCINRAAVNASFATGVRNRNGTKQNGTEQVVGRSPVFLREMKKAQQAATSDVSVLISGETGTGKEVCARTIHRLSGRSAKPFVPINGGAIPVDLIENELFGHAKEAYTGATTSRQGLIAEAEGGTLFIDEVDSFPAAAQVKLLRFLQEKEYRPLGTHRMCAANVRILAATNADVRQLLDDGRLRRDLYYRLNTIPIALPPLRDRQEDIAPLASHFLRKFGNQFGSNCRDCSPEAYLRLQHHRWPGNVRELEQTMQRAIVLSADETTMPAQTIQFDDAEETAPVLSFQEAKARVVAEFEENFIRNSLRAYRGNITRAAEAAGKNRRAFWELLRKYDIDAAVFRRDL